MSFQRVKGFGCNIYLIGFMGTGKSTVSEYMSRTYEMEKIEMDQVIAGREKMSITDIFASRGEEYFRSLETDLLEEMQAVRNRVISCGGGVVLRERNVQKMKKNGRIVLLKASPETVWERVRTSDSRPVLKGCRNSADISKLMEERREKYEAAADLTVDTDGKQIPAICEEILCKLTEMGDEPC